MKRYLIIAFWTLVTFLWSIPACILFFFGMDERAMNVSTKIVDRWRDAIWTKEEQLKIAIRNIEERYKNLFLRLDLDFDGYRKLIALRDKEILQTKLSYE